MGSTLVKWLRAVALSGLLLIPQSAPQLMAAVAGGYAVTASDEAWARSSSSSSGGYSRSSSSSSSSSHSSRTPSASSSSSSGSGGYTRSGSSSGGYTRTPSASTTSTSSASRSAGDQALSRQGSADALQRFRDKDKEPATAARPNAGSGTSTATGTGSSSGGGWSWGNRTPSAGGGYAPAGGGSWSNWYGQRGWSPAPYMNSGRSFGMWDAMFLWFMLDTMTKSSHASWFYNHQNDPGVQQWRSEAERLAKDNKDLANKLNELDKSVASMKGQPVDSKAMPSDVPTQVATGSLSSDKSASGLQQPAKSGGSSVFLWVVLILAAVLFLLWLARRRQAARNTKEDPVRLGMIGNYVSQKISGKPYEPSLFRVGMTVTIDPTPFLMSAGHTKVTAPEGGLTSVPTVGTITSGKATVYRLYLGENESFFQLHLDKDNHPDECRYFTVIDQVTPADESEWGFWLDEKEGAIGWPDFQTKDGKVYQRAWTPGGSRIQPFQMREEQKDVKGSRNRRLDAMLYAAPTGAAAPAPDKEYILVSAIDEDGQAWVEIAAGIDVSPASLSLT
jgi:hypothetical protein